MVFLTKSLMSNHQTVTKPNPSFGAGAQGQHPGPRASTPGASLATPFQAVPAAPVRPSPTPSLSLPHSARANPAPPIPPVSFSRRRAEAMPPWRRGGPAGGAAGQRGTPPLLPARRHGGLPPPPPLSGRLRLRGRGGRRRFVLGCVAAPPQPEPAGAGPRASPAGG